MPQEKFILTSKEELQSLIQDAVTVAVLQIHLPQKIVDPLSSYLNVAQACEYLKIAKSTLYSFTQKRDIPFMKKGKKLYFSKIELEKWIIEGKKNKRHNYEPGREF